jgi:hypothetical protein
MPKNYLLCFFILLKFALHYFLHNGEYDLHRDEYLHLDQAEHLAWGYTSVPPFTSWISWLIMVLGNSVFWVKFFPILFGVLTLVMVWKTVETLGGGLFALSMSAVAITFSVVLRLNILYQPNSADVLFWTLFYFAFIKYLKTDNSRWLIYAALAFGLGFLNKYNIFFQLLGILPAILLTDSRKIFIKPTFYVALLAGLLLIAPNLIWQYVNDFPVFTHLRALNKTQLVNVNRMDFLKEQLVFFYGSAFLIITGLVGFFRYEPLRPYRAFFWTFFFTLGIFTFFKAKAYYAIGLYPVYLSFGSVYLESLLKKGWLYYLRIAALALPVVALLPLIRVVFPVDSPAEIQKNGQAFKDLNLLRWEDGKNHPLPQDFADMLGWSELAAKVDSLYEKVEDKEHTLIYCDNYGQAGAINYYSRFPEIKAVSMNADYINWMDLDAFEIKNLILVQDPGDTDKERTDERPIFQSVTYEGRVENPFAREYDARIYLLKGAKTSINSILKSDMAEERKEYQ